MKKEDIGFALFSRLEAANILPAYYPNVNPSNEVRSATAYLDVETPTARREDTSLEGGTILREIGTIQISVAVPEGTGIASAIQYADQISELFPKGTSISIANGTITITAAPNIPGGFNAGAQWREPVLISYLAVRN